MKLSLEKIRTDGGTRIRPLDEENVARLVAVLEDGGTFDTDIRAWHDGTAYWLSHGFHRHEAYTRVGRKTVEVEVMEGSKDDAFDDACKPHNERNGRYETTKEKAARIKAFEARHPDWSLRKIADWCGCGRGTAERIRQERGASVPTGTPTTQSGAITWPAVADEPDDEPQEEQAEQQTDTARQAFQCATCGDWFGVPIWHCDGCGQHYSEGEECKTCVTETAGVEEIAQVQRAQPESFSVDTWKALFPDERKQALGQKTDATFNKQDNDNIEWAKWSWNPVTGCKHNCAYCYARDIANRFYPQKFEPTFLPSRLCAPANTKVPAAAAENVGWKNVFTCSMADLFGRWVPKDWIERVLEQVAANPQWNFLFLTKFPKRLAEFAFPANAWVGTSVDRQSRVKPAEDAFANVDATVKWLSIEPMLEPLEFSDLSLFNWLVLGGASRSTITPEWRVPCRWVAALEEAAEAAGCDVYHKPNLYRFRKGYPGHSDSDPKKAPKELFKQDSP